MRRRFGSTSATRNKKTEDRPDEHVAMTCHQKVAQLNRGRVSDPAQAALSGSQKEAPGSAGVISLGWTSN